MILLLVQPLKLRMRDRVLTAGAILSSRGMVHGILGSTAGLTLAS
jgi:hypothetical protein